MNIYGRLFLLLLAVAVGAKRIAAQKFPEHAEYAFVAGLLHDTGMIMLDPYILERKETFDEIISEDSVSFLEAERALLGTDHCEMGAEVLREWGIPETLLKSVARHHGPSFSSGPLVCIVHVADIMARKIGFGIRETDDVLYGVDSKALEAIGMQAEDLENFETEIIKATETVAMEVMQETE